MTTTTVNRLSPVQLATGALGLTACALFVALILVTQPAAQAIGMNDRGGDYIMLTQQLSSTTEGVVVIDAAAKQMIIYAFDYNTKTLEILRQVPLDQLPKPRDRGTPTPTPASPRRR
jgi:hypothetical protein